MSWFKRYCNTCGKYYKGQGRYYCSIKCKPSSMKGKKHKNSTIDAKGYPESNKNKIRAFQEQYPNIKFNVLFYEDLIKLGLKIRGAKIKYVKGM